MDTERAFRGFREVQLAYVGVRVGVFKVLFEHSMNLGELSRALRIPQDRLERLVRGWVWAGFMERGSDGRVALTKSGDTLVDDRPLSAADNVMFQAEFFYPAWSGLYEYATKGTIPYVAGRGEGVFETLKRDARLAALYAAPMAARSFEYSGLIAKRAELRGAKVIVDVGGGHGRLLVDVLKGHPSARGVVFDLRAMKGPAEKLIEEEGLSDRCAFKAGDVFVKSPPAADVYLMKWVLHDFGDEEAAAILKSVARGMKDGGKLLVIERVMPKQGASPGNLGNADMNMLVLSGGGERTRAEYERLMKEAGLEMRGCEQLEEKYGFYVMVANVKGLKKPRRRDDTKTPTEVQHTVCKFSTTVVRSFLARPVP